MHLSTVFEKLFGWKILAGPFAGMTYVGEHSGSLVPPKLLGTYELELFAVVDRLIADRPDVIVNVGAGEGYYAVGLARRIAGCRIEAFEANESGRKLIQQVAEQNGMAGQVRIRGFCSPGDLQSTLAAARKPWLIIDVEGAEDVLLDPAQVPALRTTRVLVEVHDFVDQGIAARLQERFAGSHGCEEIWSVPRGFGDLPWWLRVAAVTPVRARILHAMDEQRPGRMRWFVFTPKAR